MIAHRVQMTATLSGSARMTGNAALPPGMAAFPVETYSHQRGNSRLSQGVIDRLMAEVGIIEFGVMAILAH